MNNLTPDEKKVWAILTRPSGDEMERIIRAFQKDFMLEDSSELFIKYSDPNMTYSDYYEKIVTDNGWTTQELYEYVQKKGK